MFVAVPVTCLAYETQLLVGVQPNLHFLLLVYFATLFTYCFHRVYPIRCSYDGETSARFSWLQQNKFAFNTIMWIALLSTLTLIVTNMSFQLIWFVPVGAISFCYTLSVYPVKDRWVRLRDVPYLKVFLIVAVVTFVTTYLPMLYDGNNSEVVTINFALIVVARALFLCAITLPFDIRDLEFDRQTQLKTIPGKFGVNNTKIISGLLILGFMLVESIRYFVCDGETAIWLSLLVSGIIAGVFVLLAKTNGSEYFYSLGLEGTMIIQLLLLLVAIWL